MLELKLMFFTILAVGGLLWVFYWMVIRPTFLTRIHYQIFALRDSLRSLAIDGHCDASSSSFRYLEGMLNEMITRTFSYSVLEFFGASFQGEVDTDLRSIKDEGLRLMELAMFLNSPWWGLFISMVMLVRRI
jgi:hypothetical protein